MCLLSLVCLPSFSFDRKRQSYHRIKRLGYIHTYLRPSVHRRDLYGTLLDDCCCASWLISICPPRFEIDIFSVHHHRTIASIVSAPRCRRPSSRRHPCLHVSLTRQPDQLILILRVAGRGFLVCVPFSKRTVILCPVVGRLCSPVWRYVLDDVHSLLPRDG